MKKKLIIFWSFWGTLHGMSNAEELPTTQETTAQQEHEQTASDSSSSDTESHRKRGKSLSRKKRAESFLKNLGGISTQHQPPGTTVGTDTSFDQPIPTAADLLQPPAAQQRSRRKSLRCKFLCCCTCKYESEEPVDDTLV